jgi:integrase
MSTAIEQKELAFNPDEKKKRVRGGARPGPRTVERLNALALEKVRADKSRLSQTPGLLNDGRGLCLRVKSATTRSWVYRYMVNGASREMGLGAYPDISLADARTLVAEARRLRAMGKDPIAERDAQRARERVEAAKAVTFRQCAEKYIAAHRASWKNEKHAAQWAATLETYAMKLIGKIPVQSVDVAMVHNILEPIWSTKSETASRVRGRIESILDWAAVRGYRSGENPARWRGHLEKMFPAKRKVRAVEHHAALPYSGMNAFWTALAAQEGVAAAALRFTILTAARTNETIGATWAEIDLEKAEWTVPGARMKSGRDHRVPLSAPALAILRVQYAATDGKGFVFPGGKKKKALSNMAMLETLRRMKLDLTVHGFRSTFRDWAAEMTNYAGEVAEAALAHVVGDRTEAAYRRGDLFEKRRNLMDAWATYCLAPAHTATVTPIRAVG